MKKTPGLILFVIVFVLGQNSFAQFGGRYSYGFLNLTNSARVAALGGKLASTGNADMDMAWHNPALLDSTMDRHMAINYVNYFSDINYGYISYAKHYSSLGTFAGGLQYINYGSFLRADEAGNINGTFRAAEYAFNISYSRKLDSLFSVGANFKPILSTLESYTSLGVALDLGANYKSRDGSFTAGLAIKNAGLQLKAYNKGSREALPFEIIMGVSKRLKHAPFRFLATAQHLERFNISPIKDNQEDQEIFMGTPESTNKLEDFGDKALRHFMLGLEFLPSKALNLRLGYNYQRRQELKLDSRLAMVGFSWGFSLNLRKFNLSYGRASYHLAGASNHFSLAVKLGEY